MFTKRYQRMCITAVSLVLFLLTNSVNSLALESEIVIEEEFSEPEESYEINEEEIWAQIDRDELRSIVDVEKLKSSIDEEALLQKINRQELMAGINELSLLQSMGEDAIIAEFEERKASGEFDEFLNELNKERAYLEEEAEDITLDEITLDEITEAMEIVDISESGSDSESPLESVDEDEVTIDTDSEPIPVSTATLKTEPYSAEDHPLDVVNVKLPTIGESSPFDYIVDPLGLIYATGAAKYGSGKVQENAGVLFRNSEGEYDFSNTSDFINIVNMSNVPVKVELTATLQGETDVSIVDNIEMLDSSTPALFMAFTDKDGIISSFEESGKSVVTVTLSPAPKETYTFIYDEERGEYKYELSDKIDELSFDSFSFAVTADCNTQADWSDVASLPTLSVSWKTDPVLTDWDKVNAELEAQEKELFAAFKTLKLRELKEEELDRLVQLRLEELINEELDRLIDEEVERLAQEKFDELRLAAIDTQSGSLITPENVSDQEDFTVEQTKSMDEPEILLDEEPLEN